MDFAFIEKLSQASSEPLPGKEAQYLMAPADGRAEIAIREDHRIACVMLLFHPKSDGWNLSYIKRTSRNKNDAHAGQISFPGGGLEDIDNTLMDCALRETEEEIGIPQSDIKVIGRLTELYVHVSNFLVHPFVGYVEKEPLYIPQESEVSEVFAIPFDYLLDHSIVKKGPIPVRNTILNDIPYFDINGKVLWGATAMITRELLELYRKHHVGNLLKSI